MSEVGDPNRDLWLALAQPESLERVVEIQQRIEELARTGVISPENKHDLLSQAFSAMKNIAGDDPVRSRDLIVRFLLPQCLTESPDPGGAMAASQYRGILGEWLETLSSSGNEQVCDEVVDILQQKLDTNEFESACWTLGEVGRRTEEIVTGLWSVIDREPGDAGDAALMVLVALGEAEVQQLTLADEDQVLLCTDGLTEMVQQQMIAAILGDSKTSDEACQRLVAAALDNGGKDNVTVVLARYRLPIGDLGAKRESD
jgi:hypothetical protein